jgi:hypothetical protein
MFKPTRIKLPTLATKNGLPDHQTHLLNMVQILLTAQNTCLKLPKRSADLFSFLFFAEAKKRLCR